MSDVQIGLEHYILQVISDLAGGRQVISILAGSRRHITHIGSWVSLRMISKCGPLGSSIQVYTVSNIALIKPNYLNPPNEIINIGFYVATNRWY